MTEEIQHEQSLQITGQNTRGKKACNINTHFVLAVVAVCLSCFSGFFTIPLALAALILSLRVQDLIAQNRLEEADRFAYWAGLFGWITVLIALLPILLIIFFGGAILAGLTAFLSAL